MRVALVKAQGYGTGGTATNFDSVTVGLGEKKPENIGVGISGRSGRLSVPRAAARLLERDMRSSCVSARCSGEGTWLWHRRHRHEF